MKKDVHYVKATYFTSLLEAADDFDASESSKIPLVTILYVYRNGAVVDKFEAHTNE